MTEEIIEQNKDTELASQRPMSLAELSAQMNHSVQTTDEDLAAIAKARTFLPFVKIASANSRLVTKDKVCSAGDFVLSVNKNTVIKLGASFQCIPVAHRVKAMAFTPEATLTYYDPKSPEFQSVKEKSKVFENNCMSGVEILLWIPEHKTFATFYCYNVTALNQVHTIRGRYGKNSKLESVFIDNGKYTWYGPEIHACSDPFEEPDPTEAASILNDFCNPKSSEVEEAEEGGTTAERAR